MTRKIFFFFTLAIFAISSCDKIDDPWEQVKVVEIDTTKVIRKLIIEDFTGHTCGNCPSASIKASQLKDIYGEKLIIVSVHAGYFARTETNANSSFSTDFKTTAGDAYNDFFKVDIAGNPNGLVSRSKILDNKFIVAPSAWGTAIESLKELQPDVKLSVEVNFDAATRLLNSTVKSTALNNLAGKYNLVLYLVEDNIVDWQKDYSQPTGQQNVSNYNHRHVLRDNINSTWGDEIIATNLTKGDSIVKTYNYSINPKWKADDCSVIAYIIDKNTEEIIQAEEVHIKK